MAAPTTPRATGPAGRLLGLRPATVLAVLDETPTIRAVRLDPPTGFRHAAGQFVLLDVGGDRRPLSIASPPGAPALELATRLGPSPFKQALAALRPGDEVRISRPLGRYRLDRRRPAVILTGGIGITPIRSMLLAALADGYDRQIRLVASNRDEAEIPYRAELSALADAHPNLGVTWVVSGAGRHIDDDLVAPLVDELPDARFYVTGPAPMVRGLRDVLRRAGVPGRRIHVTRQTFPPTLRGAS